MKLKIENMDYHRNGICGEPFFVVLFDDLDEKKKMVASVFVHSIGNPKGNLFCSVFDVRQLAEGNIAFAQGNSWRGDQYFWELLPLMEKWNIEHNGIQPLGA